MKTLMTSLAVAVVTAVSLTGVPAGHAQAQIAHHPQNAAEFKAMAQQAAKDFSIGGISDDGNTLYIKTGTMRLTADKSAVEAVSKDGRTLLTLPLLQFDNVRDGFVPVSAKVSPDGKTVTFGQSADQTFIPMTADQKVRRDQLRLALDPNSATMRYINLAKTAHKQDPLTFYGGGLLGCAAGVAISVLAAWGLILVGFSVEILALLFFWPLYLVAAGVFVAAAGVALTSVVTCPVGWVIGSAGFSALSDKPAVERSAKGFWDALFGFNWF